jgi:integrase/recombinase XerD
MRESFQCFSLFGQSGSRKYLTAAERGRFLDAAEQELPDTCLFCLTLGWSGARISEVLALTPAAIDLGCGVCIQTLKRRRRGVFRHVPLPPHLLRQLDFYFDLSNRQQNAELAARRIWKWSRTTAWRRVKSLMTSANITGTAAMPKGLRHSFGVNAVQSKVPLPLIQRWLGHATIETTAIYLDVVGQEEQELAARMWEP